MTRHALFLNGVYESVLEEINSIQRDLPDQILFLQPYKGEAIAQLRDVHPTVEDPTLVLMSLTTDLSMVHYTAEVVGWDDKRRLAGSRRDTINIIIGKLQPGEQGLHSASRSETGESVNLLHVRRLRRLENPFSVTRLTKASDGLPLSDKRTTAGGWAYVLREDLGELLARSKEAAK